MSSKKSRVKLKDKFDTPQKNEEPFNLSYVKKSLLTSCRRVGLSKKKPNIKPIDYEDPELNQEIVSSPTNDCTEVANNDASTSKILSTSPVTVDDKPKSSTSRRKKSSHPLKRTISEPNNIESEIVTLQIVSPVSKRRKLDFIDIFNPDKVIISENQSAISVNKKVVNKNDTELKANSLKNKNGNSLTVSLPLNLSKNILQTSKKGIKEDQSDLHSGMVKNDTISTDVPKSLPIEPSGAPPPLKKRKIIEKFSATLQNEKEKEVPVSTKKNNAEEKKKNLDTKIFEQKTEIELDLGEKGSKRKKSRKVSKEIRGKTPKIKLATKSPRLNNSLKEDLDEILLPNSKQKSTKRGKVNNKVTKKPRNKSKEYDADLLNDYKAIVDNNFMVSVSKSKHEKNDITITIDKPPLLSNNCNLTIESSGYNTQSLLETKVIGVCEPNLTNAHNLEEKEDTITETPTIESANQSLEVNNENCDLSEAVPEQTEEVLNAEIVSEDSTFVDTCENSQDANIVPHIRNKAEKKIYIDLPNPEVIFTPPRVPDIVKSPKSSPSSPKTKSNKMDCDQLSEESYESSHYSPPAYSPIEIREAEEHIGDIECHKNDILEKHTEILVSPIINEECVSSFVKPIPVPETTTIPEMESKSPSLEQLPLETKEVTPVEEVDHLKAVEEPPKPSKRRSKTQRTQARPRKKSTTPDQIEVTNVFTTTLDTFEEYSQKEEPKTKLLNYYPRVLINMDDIDNYYKELEQQKQQALEEKEPKGSKTARKRKRTNTPFGFRRKRKRKSSDRRRQHQNQRKRAEILEEDEDMPQFKDDESIGRIESVFFTPPSSRSENDSDSNRNDFQVENEVVSVDNPFGEGTSMNCITPITSKVTGSTTSRDLLTLEDREVASLSTTTTEMEGSRLSENSSSDEMESNDSRPASRVPLQHSYANCGSLETYQLNENGSVTVVQRGQCIEYIKWNNSAKRKNLRTMYSKSAILNRCVYSKTSEPITSMFDSILEEPKQCSSDSSSNQINVINDVNVINDKVSSENQLPKPIELLKQVKEMESRIKSKKLILEKLNKCDNLIRNTTELRKRAQGALLEFAAVLRQQSGTPFNMESLLYNMSIPHHVVGFNADDDDFI